MHLQHHPEFLKCNGQINIFTRENHIRNITSISSGKIVLPEGIKICFKRYMRGNKDLKKKWLLVICIFNKQTFVFLVYVHLCMHISWYISHNLHTLVTGRVGDFKGILLNFYANSLCSIPNFSYFSLHLHFNFLFSKQPPHPIAFCKIYTSDMI